MDIDLELEASDGISDFLRSKLKLLKKDNESLEESLKRRQEEEEKLQEFSKSRNVKIVEVGEVWKRLCNGKYVIGVEMRNCSETDVEASATLIWESDAPLLYTLYVISAPELISVKKISPGKSFHMVFVLSVPLFSDRLTYTIFACLQLTANTIKSNLALPSTIELSSHDLTDNSIILDIKRLFNADPKEIVASKYSSKEIELIVKLPRESTRNLETYLGVDCGFIAVTEKLFSVQKISPAFDSCFLEVGNLLEGAVELNVYSKDRRSVLSLLHYLYQRIVGSVILPRSYYVPDLDLDEVKTRLQASMSKEMQELEKVTDSNFKEIRKGMLEMECETDVLAFLLNEASE